MGDLINGNHDVCTKAHWCSDYCPHRMESEAGSPACDCYYSRLKNKKDK
jgi:hypothetical protein